MHFSLMFIFSIHSVTAYTSGQSEEIHMLTFLETKQQCLFEKEAETEFPLSDVLFFLGCFVVSFACASWQ